MSYLPSPPGMRVLEVLYVNLLVFPGLVVIFGLWLKARKKIL